MAEGEEASPRPSPSHPPAGHGAEAEEARRRDLLERIAGLEHDLGEMLARARRQAEETVEDARRQAADLIRQAAEEDEREGDREEVEAGAGADLEAEGLLRQAREEVELLRRLAGERQERVARLILEAILPAGGGGAG
jgi:vacuolar-type H+-ATPase subunit H